MHERFEDVEVFAALFPGQGSQYVGMGKTLCDAFSLAKCLVEEAEDILRFSLSRVMFEGPAERLQNTFYAQPALFVVSVAAFRVLRNEFGLENIAFFAGHSLGEYSALCAAGVVSFKEALILITHRAQAMSQVTGGGMLAAIGLSREQLEPLLQENTVIANDNTPQQLILSGPIADLNICAQRIKALGARAVFLQVSGPFHSPFMAHAQEVLSPFIMDTPFSRPEKPVVTNVSALPQEDPNILKTHLIQQVSGTLLWRQTQLFFAQQGIHQFLEIGPGSVLAGLLCKTLPQASCACIEKAEDLRVFSGDSQKTFVSLGGK